MFDNLTDSFSRVLRSINIHNRLNEENIKDALYEVRTSLLEADVALPVVHDFINRVKNHAIGYKIDKNLTPRQKFIKIIKRELTSLMGEENNALNLTVQPPAIMLVVGLQGTGKTTSIGKLSNLLYKKYKKKVLVVSTDVYRPAAAEQLEALVHQIGVDYFKSDTNQKPINIVDSAIKKAKSEFYDVLLIDTTGRLHVDQSLMGEIRDMSISINPVEILLVVDAMTGQNAVRAAQIFDKSFSLTGIILTKVDSDVRGGVALSVRYMTKKPIKFLGVGEKITALEPFYPDRIASRILGMDDLLSTIKNIEGRVDFPQLKKIENKFKKGNNFDATYFLEQLRCIKNMGGIVNLVNKFPGIKWTPTNIKTQINDDILVHMEAIINSMTPKERVNLDIINGSRKRRIANGCGMRVQDINQFLKQLSDAQKIMKQINKNGITKAIHSIRRIIYQNLSKF